MDLLFKSNQITFIVTSPQHKCLGEWNSYERAPDSAKKKKKNTKQNTTIYIWTVHIYRLYRRQCAKYTYIYSVHIVYYKDIPNYQLHIIHRMGTSTLCTLQWGKKVFSQPPIVQVLPVKKMRGACNFHHRYTSTMRDKIRKKIPEKTL